MHLESSMYTITENVRAVLPHGSTANFADTRHRPRVRDPRLAQGRRGSRRHADPSAPGMETHWA